VVYAEPVQLQQVILNVCNNGVQATDGPGVISIGVDVLETEKPLRVWNDEIGPGRFVIITVSDQGRGMDEEVLERVFEPFFTTRPAGNGLGLATVREIMREHGGAATIRSTIGVGTQVDIWIPAITCDEKASTQQSSGPTVRGAGETVLLLEADGERLIRCEEVLAALGYEPLGFTDPAEALEACQTAPTRFDAALICHQIGANSALDLAVALHDVAPTLPIVLATSSVRDLDVARLATSGIYELVRRPLASAELAGALSRCLAGRASAQLQP
jgi:CheY-like chemotaxis protein